MGVPKFLGEKAMLRAVCFPEGVPSFLENWNGGAKIPRKNGMGVPIFRRCQFSCDTGLAGRPVRSVLLIYS